jgi:hypothetical protein
MSCNSNGEKMECKFKLKRFFGIVLISYVSAIAAIYIIGPKFVKSYLLKNPKVIIESASHKAGSPG